jgi:formylglycine-generating enzyme required for sulfatase activity
MRIASSLFALVLLLPLAGCGPREPRGGPPMPVTRKAEPFTHEIGLRFVVLPSGSVQVSPEHEIEFRRPLLISAHEVTNRQFEQFDPSHKRHAKAPDDEHPVINATLDEAIAFCQWLTKNDPVGRMYRLPDMGEWQYAARGGRDLARFPWRPWRPGSRPISPKRASYGGDGPKHVGSYRPNRYGLYDVIGNASEWTLVGDYPGELLLRMGVTWRTIGRDWYVLMGGSWKSPEKKLHLELPETPPEPDDEHDDVGFRVLCTPARVR